jgi:DNA-binding NarL/FixJ family response regulator
MITIVLAEDHVIVREGVRVLLDSEPEFQVVGEASDGLEAVRVVERLRPQILVLDMTMPSLNGLEVVRQISHRVPDTRCLYLSIHADEGYVVQGLRAGARGYVLKSAHASELVEAIRRVAAGERYLSPSLSNRAIEVYAQAQHLASSPDPFEALTSREREVLQLAAEGHNNPKIGARLHISPRTVEIHRANLMRKLRLGNQTDLIRYAFRRGLLSLE